VSNDKTHYRKAFDSPYLSSADIVDPVVLTIRRVVLEVDRTKKTKDPFNTAYFVERELRPGEALKPMILNATNSKFLAQITGSKWIDDWVNLSITVYVEPNVRFGKETVEGLRLAKAAQRPAAPKELTDAAKAAARLGTDAYAKFFKDAGPENRKLLASHHETLKKMAAESDARKAGASDDPPPADDPPPVDDAFVRDMDAAEAGE
jgi:hypothetical protein